MGEHPELLLELGAVLLGLALLARIASRLELSPIPLYLVAGIVLGQVSEDPLALSPAVVETAAEVGVVLLLFTLGLEYTGAELAGTLRDGRRPAAVDLALNATPGLLAGVALGWSLEGIVLLGGITYISSSGVVAKLLHDLGRLGNRETPAILGLLVMEDLAMAIYLPILAVLLAGTGLLAGVGLIGVAVGAGIAALAVAIRHGPAVSRLLGTPSDEILLLSVLGFVLLVAAGAEMAQLSAAVGAFLAGIVVSGPVAERARTLVAPLRDLFAAAFFVIFGLEVDLGALDAVLLPAIALALVSGATKLATGWWAARAIGIGPARPCPRRHGARRPRRVLDRHRGAGRGGRSGGRAGALRGGVRARDRRARLRRHAAAGAARARACARAALTATRRPGGGASGGYNGHALTYRAQP